MAVFTKKTASDGKVQYRNVTENKIVAKSSLPEDLVARLDIAIEGIEVPESADIDATQNEPAPMEDKGSATRKIELAHPILVNGKVYKKGKITVSEEIADDLIRIDEENSKYEYGLMRGQNRAREASGVRVRDIQ